MKDVEGIQYAADTVRLLTVDAVQKAQSGHPGLPMGCAELGVLLYSTIMKHDPTDPDWVDRDRFVLSAGHGSLLLYSVLFLAGYDLSLDDIKAFRTVDSITPGHPEYGMTPGVETTTGPLGQGVANAVGMAIAEEMLSAHLNAEDLSIIDHYTYALCGDGDLMEGISSEAASLAGNLELGKLVVLYDDNRATIDGTTDLTFSEDVCLRFQAYGWHVLTADAYDLDAVTDAMHAAKQDRQRPSLIRLRSTIGRGAPTKEGSYTTHGGALGDEEVRRMKQSIGVSESETFHVFPEAVEFFRKKLVKRKREHREWNVRFERWKRQYPERYHEWRHVFEPRARETSAVTLPKFPPGTRVATRVAGGQTIDAFAQAFPDIVGGSADLTIPVFGKRLEMPVFSSGNRQGRFIHFGVREHAMAAISNGISLHGGFRPFCGTFLAFSDYMRPAIRLSALMNLPVMYVFSHDSPWIGEDGPTHQPIEHVASLEAIPNLLVLRPGDAEETAESWKVAHDRLEGPTAIVLSRQDLETYVKGDGQWKRHFPCGAYIVHEPAAKPEVVLVASGSEVKTSLDVAEKLPERAIRVVSMVSRQLFMRQSPEQRRNILPPDTRIVVVNAGVSQGWESIYLDSPPILSIERFGISGPGDDVVERLDVGPDAVLSRVRTLLDSQ